MIFASFLSFPLFLSLYFSLLIVPSPNVTVTPTRIDTYLAGSQLAVYCDITIDPKVNIPLTIDVFWTMNDNIERPVAPAEGGESLPTEAPLTPIVLTNGMNDRINISHPMPLSGNLYRSILTFVTLSSSMDNGTYTCNVTVRSLQGYSNVLSSNYAYNSTSITVTGNIYISVAYMLIFYIITCRSYD